jgi:hypothetical protein
VGLGDRYSVVDIDWLHWHQTSKIEGQIETREEDELIDHETTE